MSWAQPSGLSAGPAGVYVADSESSSVRLMDAASGGARLLAGGDASYADNLFRFGDRWVSGFQGRPRSSPISSRVRSNPRRTLDSSGIGPEVMSVPVDPRLRSVYEFGLDGNPRLNRTSVAD